MSDDDFNLFACRVWDPDEYSPRLRALWDESMLTCERDGVAKPEIYADSTIGACEACKARVAVGPRARSRIAALEAAGRPAPVMCMICAVLVQRAIGGSLSTFSLGNSHDPTP